MTAPAPVSACLLWPEAPLRGLILAAFCRDTTGLNLDAEARFNLFPASPLCSLTVIQSGQLHIVDATADLCPALPPVFFSGPRRAPLVSWSPGPVRAMTLCFFPDAWLHLSGRSVLQFVGQQVPAEAALSAPLLPLLSSLADTTDQAAAFAAFQRAILPHWRPAAAGPGQRLADWVRSTTTRAALSGLGQSQRQVQRRIRHWCGLNSQELHQFARLDRLMRVARSHDQSTRIAEIAAEAGFADQAHMGRTLRRLTGQTPARINTLIESAEPFWCYRLLREFT